MSECFAGLESLLMQAIFVLAAMEHEGIMHRDIKCEHLLLTARGELALIDFGLSTKLADNSFLSEYVVTYPFRPLEIFFYQRSFLKHEPTTDQVESSSSRAVEEPDMFSSFLEKPGTQEILPYSCEADVFSLAFAFLSSIACRPLIKVDVGMPFFYK